MVALIMLFVISDLSIRYLSIYPYQEIRLYISGNSQFLHDSGGVFQTFNAVFAESNLTALAACRDI